MQSFILFFLLGNSYLTLIILLCARSYLWEEGNYSVIRDDVEDILREGKIENNVCFWLKLNCHPICNGHMTYI